MARKLQYKDAVFRKYFMHKTRVLSLYRAVSGDNTLTEDDIELKTLDNTYDNGKHNDVAFVCHNKLVVMFEHQSTINENMPVRFLLYLAQYYNELTKSGDKYRKKRISLPEPMCYVFYNGKEDTEPVKVLNLADAFANGKSEWLNLKVIAYDIKYDKGCKLFDSCSELMEYSFFVKKVEEYAATGIETNQAVYKAVNYCIEHDIMKEFMQEHRGEVEDMFTEEFDYDKAMEISKEEGLTEGEAKGRAEGEAKGRAEGKLDTLKSLVKEGLISITIAAQKAGITEEAFKKIACL